MRRLGPELKMPDVKVPPFLADVYYDLRERRLLPVVALVVVAIAAVPFLLGGSEEPLPATTPEEAAEATRLEIADASSLTVVEAKPGLRDYKKRLDGRTPTDPFVQKYTAVPEGARIESSVTSSTSSSGGGGGSSEGSVTVAPEEGSSGETAPVPAPEGDGNGDGSVKLYELVIDVQMQRIEQTADGGEKPGEIQVRHQVPVVTALPNKKNAVVTTMGANFKKERLYFLTSRDVKAIVGEFGCVTRGDVCELLEVAPGILLEYVLESGDRFTVKVTDVDAIPARKGRQGRASRASFAAPSPDTAW